MKAPTLKTRLILLLAAWCCGVPGRAQNYPGASQYWANHQQQQQPQQQQQQQPQQFQQYQPQQPAQQGGQNAYHPQQQQAGHQVSFGQQQQQQPGFRQAGQPQQQGFQQGAQQQQQPGFQHGAQQQQQQPGFQQGSQQQQPGFQQQGRQLQQQPGFQQQQQQPGFRQQFPNSPDDRSRASETTPSPFHSRLFSAGAAGGHGSPNGTGTPGTPGAASAPGGTPGQQQAGALELEPFGTVKQPQPGHPDSQVFQTPSDQSLYAVDWSYPRARNAPASLVLKRWGGLSPPEYVAVYRLRGPTPSSSAALHAGDLAASPSYSLARDEMRHYPWDASRRHGPPRWHGQQAPRDEDFELLPAGTPLRGHHAADYGQNYMFRTL